MSGKLPASATKAWNHAPTALERITLHECRHTYASFLMAAHTRSRIMETMGHSNLAMVQRYVKLLPRPEKTDPPGGSTPAWPNGRRPDTKSAVVSTRVSTGGRSCGQSPAPPAGFEPGTFGLRSLFAGLFAC